MIGNSLYIIRVIEIVGDLSAKIVDAFFDNDGELFLSWRYACVPAQEAEQFF